MEFTNFVRKPFTVEATEVTAENMAEVAELIGVLRVKDNRTPYIAVDRRLVPNLYRVYTGFWLTQMGDNVRCYSKRVFKQQFVESTSEIESWVEYISSDHRDEDVDDEDYNAADAIPTDVNELESVDPALAE